MRVFVPPSRSGITNSPMTGINTRKQPASIPGKDKGIVTVQKVLNGRQPRSAAGATGAS